MSACNIIRDLMPLYHDSAISAESRRLVREHLRTCPDCRRFDRELSADRRRSPKTPTAPVFSSDPTYTLLMKRMQEQERKRARMRILLSGLNLTLSATLLTVLLTKKH